MCDNEIFENIPSEQEPEKIEETLSEPTEEISEQNHSDIPDTPEDDDKTENIKHIIVISIALTVILLLELFVFNFNSFHTLSPKYEEKKLDLSTAQLNNVTYSDRGISVSGQQVDTYFILEDINMPVGTINVDAWLPDNTDSVSFKIAYADATSSGNEGTRNINMEIVNYDERSKTIPCHLTGDVSFLKFKFSLGSNKSLLIKSVTINSGVPFSFSPIRVFGLLILFLIIYAFVYTTRFSSPFKDDKRLCKIAAVMITAVLIVSSFGVTSLYRDGRSHSISNDFKSRKGDQITQEIVDAFKNGQTHLTTEPSDKLLALENPYDPDLRNKELKSSDYLWDHLLYEGKYYSYYGIGPVLVLFLPYHLLTGYYFPSTWAVLLFAIIGICGLTMVYYAFVRKWFKEIPTSLFIIGLLMLQFSSGIFSSISRPEFYEIAISSAFAFNTFGFYFLLTSNILGDGKVSFARLALSSLFISISVLSRPTMAVYAVVAVIFIAYGFFSKFRKEEKFKGKKLSYLGYWCASMIPFAIFGSAQMLYNYSRFGSIFDFGIKYSLTINDFTQSQFHTAFVAVSIYAFIFAVPYFLPSFPFVFSSFQYLDINGYYFVDRSGVNALSVGVFFRALPMFAYFVAHKALAKIDKAHRKAVALLGGLFCLLAPIVIVVSVWESGYSQRYNADFSWEMLIGALALCFIMYLNMKHEDLKPLAMKLFIAALVLCFIVNFGQCYSMMRERLDTVSNLAAFNAFERVFEFWR